jgi:serine/threonine protein kinase
MSRESVNAQNLQRFTSEIFLLARLHHPNIIGFVGTVLDIDNMYILIEYASMGDLRDCLSKDFAADWDFHNHKLRVLVETCKGMEYLHSLDPIVMHRDLKTENVLVTDHLQCKVSDFGESRDIGDATMTCVGTPYYIAPEVFRGEHYDESADVFSFGIIMCAVACGGDLAEFFTEAFERMGVNGDVSGMAVPAKIAMGWRPTFPQKWEDELPTLTKLIRRCWHAAHAHRPAFSEIHEILDKFWSTNKFFVAEEQHAKHRQSVEVSRVRVLSQETRATYLTLANSSLAAQLHRKESNARRLSKRNKRASQDKINADIAAANAGPNGTMSGANLKDLVDTVHADPNAASAPGSPKSPGSPKQVGFALEERRGSDQKGVAEAETKGLPPPKLPGAMDSDSESSMDSEELRMLDDKEDDGVEDLLMTVRSKSAAQKLTGMTIMGGVEEAPGSEFDELPREELVALVENARDDLHKMQTEHNALKKAMEQRDPGELAKIQAGVRDNHRKASMERRKSVRLESEANYSFNIMALPEVEGERKGSKAAHGSGAGRGIGLSVSGLQTLKETAERTEEKTTSTTSS